MSRLTSDSGRRRTAAIRWAWMSALAIEMSGSIPDAEVLAASTGTLAAVRPRSYGALSLRYALMFAAISRSVAMLFGPRFENVVAAALSGGVVADGRDWK